MKGVERERGFQREVPPAPLPRVLHIPSMWAWNTGQHHTLWTETRWRESWAVTEQGSWGARSQPRWPVTPEPIPAFTKRGMDWRSPVGPGTLHLSAFTFPLLVACMLRPTGGWCSVQLCPGARDHVMIFTVQHAEHFWEHSTFRSLMFHNHFSDAFSCRMCFPYLVCWSGVSV